MPGDSDIRRVIMNENDFIKKEHFGDPILKEWVNDFGELPIHIQIERAKKIRDMEGYR